jgi:hypothetical protein
MCNSPCLAHMKTNPASSSATCLAWMKSKSPTNLSNIVVAGSAVEKSKSISGWKTISTRLGRPIPH